MTFRVGQKVVCVKDDAWSGNAFGDERFPSFDGVYTIRELGRRRNMLWLRLNEIVNPRHDYCRDGVLIEAAWDRDAFRPIVERSTDISIFTAMLTPKKTRVRA